jgi:hypothetical protein
MGRPIRGHPKEAGPMTDHATPSPTAGATIPRASRWSTATVSRVLAVVTAALLAVDA